MIVENRELRFESDQTLERIMEVITEAIESGKKLEITQQLKDGMFIKGNATPISIDGNILEVDAEGLGMSLELGSLVRADIIEEKEKKGE